MNDSTWHVPDNLLVRFALDVTSLDDVTAASIEAHLVACASCRDGVTAAAPAVVEATWIELADVIDRPRSSFVERAFRRMGVGSATSRVLAATLPLRAAGLIATVVVAAGAVALSRGAGADGPFLVLAPLAPLATVAAAFARVADPGGEAGIATPLHGAGLAVRRAATVLAVAFVTLGAASLALPSLSGAAEAWVLPGLALALSGLALATWVRIEAAVVGLSFAWCAGVTTMRFGAGWHTAIDSLALFGAGGQAAAVTLAVAAAAVLAARRDRLATLEVLR